MNKYSISGIAMNLSGNDNAIKYHILDEEKNVIEADFDTWAKFIKTEGSTDIAKTLVENRLFVSTVFLPAPTNTSLPFETMIFDRLDQSSSINQTTVRSPDAGEALDSHMKLVLEAKQWLTRNNAPHGASD